MRVRTSSLRLLLLPLALAPAACDHQVDDGPAPTIASLAPDLVCTEQLTTSLSLTGTAFTPLPIRTLGGSDGGMQPQSLQLPAISLTESSALDGTAAMGMPVAIPDSPDAPSASRVKWQSETSMSFQIFPDLKLTPGVYDVNLANPDGKKTTLAHALAALPPPSLKGVTPMEICDAQSDQTVTVAGASFLVVGSMVPTVTLTPTAGGMGKTYTPTTTGCAPVATMVMAGVQECTGLSFVVKMGDLAPGDYTITITNPGTASCSSTETLKLTVSPPPKVTGVTPMTICQGGGALDVKGMNFQMGAKVTVGTADAGSVTFVSPMELQAVVGGGNVMFTPGMKYDVTVKNPDGCSDTLPMAVLAVPGPVLFFVDPPVVYNGVTTQVTLYTTSVTPPLGEVSIQLPGGQKMVLAGAMIDPKHPKRVLVNVPTGTPAGTYDVHVTDASGCPATLPMGLQVVDKATVPLTAITPNFGWEQGATAVTITASSGLLPTPRVYLNPHTPGNNTVATALSSVAYFSATKITAIVPPGLSPAANPYDVIVVNPDGTVGVLTMPTSALYSSETNPPPTITAISPQSLAVPAGGSLTITGTNFRSPTVTFLCGTGANPQSLPATVTSSTGTSIVIGSAPVTALTAPTLCVIKVTNGDDMSFATFESLAISGSSGNLSTSTMGTALPMPRRALSLLANSATSAARFLYAIGGDTGMSSTATDTVFTISVDQNGPGTTWFTQRYKLNKPRTLAGQATLGRYLYVAGGNDGTGPVATVERALVLDPLQAPVVSDVDIAPGGGMGLGGGVWYYRVAALMDANDADNPGGETLPSDETTLQLPDVAAKLQVTLTWKAVPGAVGYRIYRSPVAGKIAGQEEHLADVTGAGTLTFTDLGMMTVSTDPPPLVQGSTGKWKVLPAMTTPRESPGVAIGVDPGAPLQHYLYATFGRGSGGALGSYEFLPVLVDATTGAQTYTTWKAGASTATARYQHAIYSVTNATASNVPASTNYIFVGGGTQNGTLALQALDAGKVTAGGDLGTFVATGKTIKKYGTGYVAAANYLYAFSGDGAPLGFDAAQISTTPPAVSSVNNNGSGLLVGRYLPGSTLEGALIYLAGGSDATGTTASTSLEWLVY